MRLRVLWSAQGDSAWLAQPGKTPSALYRGAVAGTLAPGPRGVLVALTTDAPAGAFRVGVVRSSDGGVQFATPYSIRHPGSRGTPFAASATSTPEGFAVLFQEVESANPSNAHTYLAELDHDGRPRQPVTEVAIPWSLGALVYNGRGFHLAALYPGGADGMRLSMVSLTRAGKPEQHPDWASPAGFISDVHLVRRAEGVLAFYRGGAMSNQLLESDVTRIKQWGREPPAPRRHGQISSKQVILIQNGTAKRISSDP